MKNILLQEVKKVLKEAVKVNFKGQSFVLKVDVNEDPNKKGIKVQFIPASMSPINPTEQNEIAIELSSKLDAGLKKFGMQVERDRELKDKSIIGFFIYIEYLDKIIRQALEGQPQTPPTA
jgi:hypothetical protein